MGVRGHDAERKRRRRGTDVAKRRSCRSGRWRSAGRPLSTHRPGRRAGGYSSTPPCRFLTRAVRTGTTTNPAGGGSSPPSCEPRRSGGGRGSGVPHPISRSSEGITRAGTAVATSIADTHDTEIDQLGTPTPPPSRSETVPSTTPGSDEAGDGGTPDQISPSSLLAMAALPPKTLTDVTLGVSVR